MKLLLDTELLLWAAAVPSRLAQPVREMIENPDNEPFFSAVSLWEIAIKAAHSRGSFSVDAAALRRGLLANGYGELPVMSQHAVAVTGLPAVLKDPFDRMLVAQSIVERIALLTSDPLVARYGEPVSGE
jgi:PIN domain nuclease of toxin-antitoxin system